MPTARASATIHPVSPSGFTRLCHVRHESLFGDPITIRRVPQRTGRVYIRLARLTQPGRRFPLFLRGFTQKDLNGITVEAFLRAIPRGREFFQAADTKVDLSEQLQRPEKTPDPFAWIRPDPRFSNDE